MGKNRFAVNPFPDLQVTEEQRQQLVDLVNGFVDDYFQKYEEFVVANKQQVDEQRWKHVKSKDNFHMYTERIRQDHATGSETTPVKDLPVMLGAGTFVGQVDDLMFGVVNPTIDIMHIKASYVHDLDSAAVLCPVVEPSEEEPFRSIVIKWMTIDLPLQSTNLVKSRDFVYIEATGILHFANGDRVGYHLLHSIDFPQTKPLPNKIRSKLSVVGFFRQITDNVIDCFASGTVDPGGKMARFLRISFIALDGLLIQRRISFCTKCVSEATKCEAKDAARDQAMGYAAYNAFQTSSQSDTSESSIKDSGKIERDENFEAPGVSDLMEFSADGKQVLLVRSSTGFTVRDSDSGAVLVDVANPGIQAVAWSPLGTQLLTWQRPQKDSDLGNLIVWDAVSGRDVARFNQKSYTRDKWPPLQWSSDETICARQSANGVVLYGGRDIAAGPIGQINLPNVANFSVAPGSAPYKVSLFVPEKKGKPASVKIYQFPNGLDTPSATKSFYKAQDVSLKWSPTGSALIIETRTDIDTSGKSYYGETGLFFLQSDGEYDCIVPLTKEGTVHDVAWDPTGRGFVVIAGAMPAHATLYDNKALPIFEFGAAPRNHVSWSPHGRFLCLAGFGNLRGDMDFWERNKLKKMGSATSNSATTFAWSPDSRYFATATTFPRLRVDNGFKVFRYDGAGPIHQEERGELYDLQFRPAAPDTYPNRPQSPRRKGEEAGFGSASVPKAAPKPQAYRPPNSTGALAAMMRKEESGAKKLDRNKYAAPRGGTVPGMGAPRVIPGMGAAAAPKKLTKSARKKKAQEAAETKAAVEEALAKVNVAAPTKPTPTPAPVNLSPEEKAKKVKALLKKLKQIDSIKAKKEAGESLNEDQLQKLQSEQTLRDEVAELSA
ncbi:hypothetical protein JM16_006561 [Phytophthora kernoviae]|uniref:Eukaryotic translation initiation factor 2A n=1 Tax=Phytophthora kernoviae TaxID=325452 RepID=A0A8T0LVC9_9STRA|nr:hypothetical protein JM16_006561 [Phytophthora kernoviae]